MMRAPFTRWAGQVILGAGMILGVWGADPAFAGPDRTGPIRAGLIRTGSIRAEPTSLPMPPAGHLARHLGVASWYGGHHHGRKTASGEVFSIAKRTAAHRSLPLGTMIRVTNLGNGRHCLVKVNDRGPYVRGRILDLSEQAARDIGMHKAGTALVRIDVVGRAGVVPD